MSREIDISIVTVTYNSAETVKVLLDSIKKSPDKLNKQVIVIDNQSPDNSFAVAKNHPLKPEVTQMPVNIGFPKAVNQGLDKARGKYILLINPDTKIIGAALTKLYQFAQNNPRLGALAPQLVNPDGKSQASVFHFPTITNAVRKYFFNCPDCFGKYQPANTTQNVDGAVMAALLVPRAVFNQVGFLDERFFMYYEDIEFCRRLKKPVCQSFISPKPKSCTFTAPAVILPTTSKAPSSLRPEHTMVPPTRKY